jgi:hypothetical protein
MQIKVHPNLDGDYKRIQFIGWVMILLLFNSISIIWIIYKFLNVYHVLNVYQVSFYNKYFMFSVGLLPIIIMFFPSIILLKKEKSQEYIEEFKINKPFRRKVNWIFYSYLICTIVLFVFSVKLKQ